MASSVAYCTLVTTDGYVTGRFAVMCFGAVASALSALPRRPLTRGRTFQPSPAALVLAKSLRDTGTRIPLAVLTTPHTVSPPALARLRVLFDLILEVPPLGGGGGDDDACAASNLRNLALMGRPDLAATLTKLHLWSLTQFERVLYLDADTLVLRSLDPLLLLQPPPPTPPGGLAASPELGFPDCFNSGVMLLAPDAGTHAALLRLAARTASFDGGDQGLLNMFFGDGPHAQQHHQQGRKASTGGMSDSADSGVALGAGGQQEAEGEERTASPLGPVQEEVPAPLTIGENHHHGGGGGGGSTWHRLSFTYNIEMHRVYRLYMPAILRYRDEHKVLHFIGRDKPWHFADGMVDVSKDPSPYSRFYADMVARWWRVRRSLPAGVDEALST
ncbi:hypothetical protein RB598_001815 [Gaeumannomyces tritici]